MAAPKLKFRQYQKHAGTNFQSVGAEPIFSERLNLLIRLNREFEQSARLDERILQNPLSLHRTISLFGLILGIFVPAAVFLKVAMNARIDVWIMGILLIVNLITAVVGFFSGKFVAKAVSYLENLSWPLMLLSSLILGLIWGVWTGAAGGIIIFIVGAFFSGAIGGLVGLIALPLFTIFHRLLKYGESIETAHFWPIAFGITFSICGFILGL